MRATSSPRRRSPVNRAASTRVSVEDQGVAGAQQAGQIGDREILERAVRWDQE